MTEQIMSKGIQCRVQNSDYHIHIQAIGPIETNRPYGGAWELRAPVEVVEWCGEQSPIYKSAASTGIYYVRMDVLMFETGAQALLIHGEEFNHPKGLMMGCNPKSPAVKAVIEYAYQTDLMSDAVFNDKVSEIVLEEAPVMLEETDTQTWDEALKETDTQTMAEALKDEMVSSSTKIDMDSDDGFAGLGDLFSAMAKQQAELDASVEDQLNLGKCKTCGDKMSVVPVVKCEKCEAKMCEDCYYTPADCALCEKETHGGAMVWCVDCVDYPVAWHHQHECEAYCPLGTSETGCDMPKPCNCTDVLESDEGEEE